MPLPVARSEQSTLGVEWELTLVDDADGTLKPVGDRVLVSMRIGRVAPGLGLPARQAGDAAEHRGTGNGRVHHGG